MGSIFNPIVSGIVSPQKNVTHVTNFLELSDNWLQKLDPVNQTLS